MKPNTCYTKSGRINIAYQVFGSGDKDLVYIPGWISNIDLMWDCPPLVSFFLELSKVVRIILFDKRGTGLSDRVSDLSTLEDRMDDIRAVMDAVGSNKAILFGHSEGGSVSALFSATYPHRTEGLIAFGAFAKRRWSVDYPWAPTDIERQDVYEMIDSHWGSGEMDLVSLAPSMENDKNFMDWLARYFRSGASPSAALALTKMNTDIDIRGILPSISVPTLLLQRSGDVDVKIEEGRYMSDQIRGSKFIELSGEDHLFWAGDAHEVLDLMVHFIQNDCRQQKYTYSLATLLKIKFLSNNDKVQYTQNAEYIPINKRHKDIVAEKVHQYLGNLIEIGNDFALATFPGPSKAVHCAIDIQALLQKNNIQLSQGMHIGEIDIIDRQKVSGLTLDVTDKILANSLPNQILLTNTVMSLLSGTGLKFSVYGTLSLSESTTLKIFALKDPVILGKEELVDNFEIQFHEFIPKSHSLLESVLSCIENHLTDEVFGINSISKELGISPRQLQRKIKAITNKSPNSLIRSVRLHRAKELIIQRNKSVKEAAFETGFSSVSYFSSSFKKEFGASPSSI